MRPDGRSDNALRPVVIERNYTCHAEGAVLIACGMTKVLCTATVDKAVPPWLRESGRGWVTAEYAMLPRSAGQRISRDSARKGRAMEISRLIGRSLRAVVDLEALGQRQVIIDCDVIQADGGTRTAAITGGYVALCDALAQLVANGDVSPSVLLGQCAAVSVGIVEGRPLLDLCYEEDVAAEVDMNIAMRNDGAFIEVQGSAEGSPFTRPQLDALLDLGQVGAEELFELQRNTLNA